MACTPMILCVMFIAANYNSFSKNKYQSTTLTWMQPFWRLHVQ